MPRSDLLRRPWRLLCSFAVAALAAACSDEPEPLPRFDLILEGGTVVDGSGAPGRVADIGIVDRHISHVGDLALAEADERLDVTGGTVVPGFIDMRSSAALDADDGRDARHLLHQGITTAVLGTDGLGRHDVSRQLEGWAAAGIGVNALAFAGHARIRGAVLGDEDRAPTPAEVDSMRTLMRRAMEEGALGLSTDLFRPPGSRAALDEVVELALAAGEWPGAIYDARHGAPDDGLEGVEFEATVEQAIRIGEESGLRVVFSHFEPWGRAETGIRTIEAARLRGVEVAAAWAGYGPRPGEGLPPDDDELVALPWIMTATDGDGHGAFPRKMRLFALDGAEVSVPFAVRSMSGLAADFLRLPDRGYIRPGMWADIAVLDLDRYRSTATNDDPREYATGVNHLLVNGAFAIRDGDYLDGTLGMPLRRDGSPVSRD
ncbi:amidohydrolase family protein [Gemmatimonadota bacterium DH-20]|uniref:Amidohydrolase family protein n=1 Tax=Gaopeijia maritima TaxID=3119007 RepID=A0ABU9EBD0_9BACT